MTWSIAAKDPKTGALGVAVTTKFFAVGSLCPFVASGVGAVSTQALVNPTFGPRGLRLLQEGLNADQAIDRLVQSDKGREHRQLHLIDNNGNAAAWSRCACIGWYGHKLGDGFSVAGNMLASKDVLEHTYKTFSNSSSKSFAQRFLDALDAGQAAGGDYRGSQSAALLIFTTEEYPYLSLRVDDHCNPLKELRRLYHESQKDFLPFLDILPSQERPDGIFSGDTLNRILERQKACQSRTD
tara:strand:+ start:763 stop:1482 length:720 start_codon:yes stop_codon:yes gene_type:complete